MSFDLVAFGLGAACGSLASLGFAWALEEMRLKANVKRSLGDIPDVLASPNNAARAVRLAGVVRQKANTGRMNHDIPDVLAGNLDALFAARDQQISEQQANESRHSRRVGLTMGDVHEVGDYLGAEYNCPLTEYVNLEGYRTSLPESERDGDAILARLDAAFANLDSRDIAYLDSQNPAKGGEKANAGRHSRRVGEVC